MLTINIPSSRPTLKGLLPQELEQICVQNSQPSYRAKQLFEWIYGKQAKDIDSMLNLPQGFKKNLEENFEYQVLRLETVTVSIDGTKKFLFATLDGRSIETVLIPSEMIEDDGTPRRLTICVSTQVGCPLNCQFCATASLKLKRNLTTGEIVEQLLLVQQHTEQTITNLVFMGMGEPLLNYDNVMKAVDILTHPLANILSPKRITLSTAGMVDGIKRMADENKPIKLALSLHATKDSLRSQLMPINKKHDLKELGQILEYYYRHTRNPITFEYILFDGLNDSDEDIKRIARLTRRFPSKVNVIPFHPINFTQPSGVSA